MKRAISFILTLCLLAPLGAIGALADARPTVVQIDEQLTGTWLFAPEPDKGYILYTFYNGRYAADTYLKDGWLDNPSVGTYTIGAETIITLVDDQENQVEGGLPYDFTDGVLTLQDHRGNPLTKQDPVAAPETASAEPAVEP